jgi:transposase
MTTVDLSDTVWTKLHAFLRSDPHVYVGNEAACRRFLEAVLWIDRSGAQWRFLPKEYGNWNSIYKRFARWCDQGVWERMLAHFAHDPDMEHGIVDSTIVRAHPCAAGAQKKAVLSTSRRWDEVEEGSAPNSTSSLMAWAIRCVSI